MLNVQAGQSLSYLHATKSSVLAITPKYSPVTVQH